MVAPRSCIEGKVRFLQFQIVVFDVLYSLSVYLSRQRRKISNLLESFLDVLNESKSRVSRRRKKRWRREEYF